MHSGEIRIAIRYANTDLHGLKFYIIFIFFSYGSGSLSSFNSTKISSKMGQDLKRKIARNSTSVA